MSQEGSLFVAGSGGSGITQINGDTGNVTGSIVTIYADNAANGAGSTVLFANSGTISKLQFSDANSNTYLGAFAGNVTNTSVQNTGVGVASLSSVDSAADNSACGAYSLSNCTTGQFNCALGFNSLDITNSGSYNLGIGIFAGDNQNGTEDSTIMLNSYGIAGVSNALFIGNATGTNPQDLNSAYIQGVYSNTQDPSGTVEVVTIDTTSGKLGVTTAGVVSIAGDVGSISGQNLTIYANNASNESGATVLFTNSGTTSTLSLSDAISNTFLGHNSGAIGTLATANTSIGVNNLTNLVFPATHNVMIGVDCGPLITTGSNNIGINNCFSVLTTGSDNIAIGAGAMTVSVSDNNNVAIGNSCLLNLNGGSGANVAIGYGSGSALYSGGGNVGIGNATFSDGGGSFDNLVAIGTFAMRAVVSNFACTAIGNIALASSVSDVGITAIGDSCLTALNGGSYDTFLGYNAGVSLVTGSNCVGIGVNSLGSSVNDSSNVAVGHNSLSSLNGGELNSCSGTSSGEFLVSGNNNLLLGSFAGNLYTSNESNNICLNSDGGGTGENFTLRIGSGTGTGARQLGLAYISGISGAPITSVAPTPYLTLTDTSSDQIVCPVPVSAASATSAFGSLSVGTALQNTSLYPIMVNVSVDVTAAVTAAILVGVGATNTPTAQAVTGAFSVAQTYSFSFVVPSQYYAEITTSGTITVGSITTFVTQIG